MTDLRARALSSELMLVRALGGGFQEDPETRLRAVIVEPTLLAEPASKAVGPMR
jgi:hypothetical protein